MMKSIVVLISLLTTGYTTTKAQTAEDSVKAVINKMFASMKNADATGLKSVLADSALLQTITRDKDGRVIITNEPFGAFLDFVSKQTPGDADERIQFDMIRIDGPLASVWTPYQFYYKGRFRHCGVNSFQVVRVNNGWKIQYIIHTMRKDKCD